MTKRSWKKILVSSVSALCAGSLLTTAGFAAPVMSYSILNSSRNVENNTITSNVTTYFKDTIASGSVYAAIYNSDGTLKSVESYPVANANNKTFQLTVPKDKASYNASFFLWDGTTLAPLAGKKALAESDKPSYDVPNFNQDIYGARFAFESGAVSDKIGYYESWYKDYIPHELSTDTSYTGGKSLKITAVKETRSGNWDSNNMLFTAKIGTLPETTKKLTLSFKVKIPSGTVITGSKAVSAGLRKIDKTEFTGKSTKELDFVASNNYKTCNVNGDDWVEYKGFTVDYTDYTDKEVMFTIKNQFAMPIGATIYIDDIVLRALDAENKEIAGFGYDDKTYEVHLSFEKGLIETDGYRVSPASGTSIVDTEYYDGSHSLGNSEASGTFASVILKKFDENVYSSAQTERYLYLTCKVKGKKDGKFAAQGGVAFQNQISNTMFQLKKSDGTYSGATFSLTGEWQTYEARLDISSVDFKALREGQTSKIIIIYFRNQNSTADPVYIDDIRIETGAAGTLYDDNIVTE